MLILLAAGSLGLLIACVLYSDADLTLMYADKYGRKLGDEEIQRCEPRMVLQRAYFCLRNSPR